MLYFNLNERPKELFDKIIEVRVLNSKVLLLESLIGSFKFDVGMAYDEPGMCSMCIYSNVIALSIKICPLYMVLLFVNFVKS